jgi:hypothetical protein
MLSAQQIKTLLTMGASNHLRKLNRVAALELADAISAADPDGILSSRKGSRTAILRLPP